MNESVTNLRSLFQLDAICDRETTDGWSRQIVDHLAAEVKGITWTAAIPDFAAKIGELLDLEIPELLVIGWRRAEDLKEALAESAGSPGETIILVLSEHTITTEHEPYIEIRLLRVFPVPKRIVFKVTLVATLVGIELRIRSGRIEEISAGKCSARGTLSLGGMQIAAKHFGTFPLDGWKFDPDADFGVRA